MTKPLSPYKGNEPYIFISYAHRDSERVFPIIRKLQEASYRVWYDEGVDPGTEWDDNIAGYINRCSVLIAFLTENYVASKNCKDEISYSRELDKNQLLVYLEDDLDLPDGLKMRLNRLQAIYWNRYSNTDDAFKALCGAPVLSICKKTDTASEQDDTEKDNTLSQTASLPEKSADSVRIKLKKPVIIGLCAAAAALVVILAVILGGRKSAPAPDSAQESASVSAASTDSSVSAESEAAVTKSLAEADASSAEGAADETQAETVDVKNSEHIVLIGNEEMTDDEFSAAVEILKGRLDILTGDSSYQMTVEDNSIDLWLPKDSLAGQGILYTLRCYLSRSIDLYAFENFRDEMEQESTWSGTYGRILIERDEVEKVSIQHGAVVGADSSKLAARGIESGTYTYLELVLTDDGAKRLAEETEAWEDGLSFAQDMENSTWYNFYTVPGKDGKTFYLVSADQEERFYKLMEYNYTHDPIAYGFYYSQDLNEITEWEMIESPDVEAGKNQCNADEFTEKTITFELKGYHSDEYTKGEWYDLNAALKERLDALEIPYAFALRVEGSYTIATVRCPLRHMGGQVIYILAEKYWKARAGFTERSLYNSSVMVTVDTKNSGSYEIELEKTYESNTDLEALSQAAVESGDGVITLFLGDYPCLQATVNDVVKDGRLTFDQCFLNNSKEITEDYAWYVNLLDTAWNGTPLPVPFELDSIQFNPDQEGNIATSEDFEITDVETILARQAVQEIYPGADVYSNSSTTLYISIDLEINEKLPEQSLALAEEIYNAVDFENSYFSSIVLYLVEENNSVLERARIFFYRDYSTYEGDEPGFIYAKGMFFGGRVEEYKELMQEAVKNNEFFTGLNKSEGEDDYLHNWQWQW